MKLKFECVQTNDCIGTVADLAHTIWTEYYTPLIGTLQVKYMLERFQSIEAIQAQIQKGIHYVLVFHSGAPAGYFALDFNSLTSKLFISKIYVHSAFRRLGIGSHMLSYIRDYANQHGSTHIWLTVNRQNASSIAFYKSNGFVITQELVQDIGNGFVMDDYRMEQPL